MSLARPLRRPIVATLLILLALGGWELWSRASGTAKAGGLGPGAADERLGVAVTLDFPPEAFHVTRLPALGRVVRTEGRTIYLLDVPRRSVERLARNYWVVAVRPWAP